MEGDPRRWFKVSVKIRVRKGGPDLRREVEERWRGEDREFLTLINYFLDFKLSTRGILR